MLTEFDDVRQIEGEDERRLFTDEYFSLFVWYRGGGISGFQLCYDKLEKERSLMWTADHGYSHYAVDSGEKAGLGMKKTPVFSGAEVPLAADLADRFEKAAASLEENIRELVLRKTRTYHA